MQSAERSNVNWREFRGVVVVLTAVLAYAGIPAALVVHGLGAGWDPLWLGAIWGGFALLPILVGFISECLSPAGADAGQEEASSSNEYVLMTSQTDDAGHGSSL